jgi:uncharacterized damage-inducible protein DinB
MQRELNHEASTTRRLLERIPADKLSWKPHHKARTLGQLALHIARLPGGLTHIVQLDEFDISQSDPEGPSPGSTEEILAAFEQSVSAAAVYLGALQPETAAATWRLKFRDKELFAMPRTDVLRGMMLNHWYHHRGQLSVYLRMLDVPIPIIYGRSADEVPFA